MTLSTSFACVIINHLVDLLKSPAKIVAFRQKRAMRCNSFVRRVSFSPYVALPMHFFAEQKNIIGPLVIFLLWKCPRLSIEDICRDS
jgi:hypothetical protein